MIPDKIIYISLMVGSVLFPFLFSFEKQIQFFKKWKFLFIATAIPATFFIIWDSWFTQIGVWSFNNTYILGPRLLGLPLEEWLFFVIIPYCSVFVYEVIKSYFPKLNFNKEIYISFVVLLLIFALLTYVYSSRDYTFYNFLFNTIMLSFLLLNKWFKEHLTHFTLAFVVSLVPMFIVNGVLTAMPVVEYNSMEISNIRIYTIPFEDFFYFFLLFMMNIVIYEQLQRKRAKVNNKLTH